MPTAPPSSIRAVLTAGLLCTSLGAFAQAGPAEHDFSFSAGLSSDYRYRGIAQTRFKPAVSAGADYSHASGLYLGTWLSSIRWIQDSGGDASFEWDVYAGYRGSAGAVGYDVGVLRYQYPGARLAVSPNTTEIHGALSYEALTVKYSHALTHLFGVDDSQGSGYLDLSATFDLGDGWSVVPHIGRQWVRHNRPLSYTDYAVTLTKDFGNGLSASAAVVGTDADKALYATPAGRFTGRTGLVVAVQYSF